MALKARFRQLYKHYTCSDEASWQLLPRHPTQLALTGIGRLDAAWHLVAEPGLQSWVTSGRYSWSTKLHWTGVSEGVPTGLPCSLSFPLCYLVMCNYDQRFSVALTSKRIVTSFALIRGSVCLKRLFYGQRARKYTRDTGLCQLLTARNTSHSKFRVI